MPDKKTPVKKTAKGGAPTSEGHLAAILLRGLLHTRHDVRKALYNLRLRKKHVCVIIPDSASHRGLLSQCKDYLTWVEIEESTIKELDTQRKKIEGKISRYHLNSPKGGFERKGIKISYHDGGALGYRSNKINDLIKKMM